MFLTFLNLLENKLIILKIKNLLLYLKSDKENFHYFISKNNLKINLKLIFKVSNYFSKSKLIFKKKKIK